MDIFFLKLLDSVLNTARSKFFNDNRHLLASFLSGVTTMLYFLIVVKLLKINSLASITMVSVASFLGSYFPPLIIEHFEKDKVYVYDITPNEDKAGRAFARKMRKIGFAVVTYKSFNKYNEPVICAKVFSKNREQSRTIKNNIPKGFKFHAVRALD